MSMRSNDFTIDSLREGYLESLRARDAKGDRLTGVINAPLRSGAAKSTQQQVE